MPNRPLIVLSLEGLTPRSLGCYGCSWNATPAIDRLAAGGCVWDRCVASSDDPAQVIGDWVERDNAQWAEPWKQRGAVELLIDDTELLSGIRHPCFDSVEAVSLAALGDPRGPAGCVEETQFGQLIAAAIERGLRDPSWSVLWLHSGFLTRCWDAPRELIEIDNDGDESQEPMDEAELLELEMKTKRPADLPNAPPLVFDEVQPPAFDLPPGTHPDLVSSWMRTYGCQIRLIDLLLEILLDSLEPLAPKLALVGTSGFRLGQAGSVGHRPPCLRSPDIHLPVLVGNAGPLRIPHLTNSHTVFDWIGRIALAENDPTPYPPSDWKMDHETLRIETESSRCRRAITTSDWFYVGENDLSERLYMKPDDIDDCNDVATLRRDVIRVLAAQPTDPDLPTQQPQ